MEDSYVLTCDTKYLITTLANNSNYPLYFHFQIQILQAEHKKNEVLTFQSVNGSII